MIYIYCNIEFLFLINRNRHGLKNFSTYIEDFAENAYLNEGLFNWFSAFFKKVFKSQSSRLVNNKVNMYDVDENTMKFAKEPVPYDKVDKETRELWKNSKIGFPVATDMMNNEAKYLKDGDIQFTPMVETYFSQDKDSTYSVGLIIYDKDHGYIDNYVHLLDFETNLIVDNPTDVQKAMIKQFGDKLKKENKEIIGFTCKPTHAKLMGNVRNMKFKKSEIDNKVYNYTI